MAYIMEPDAKSNDNKNTDTPPFSEDDQLACEALCALHNQNQAVPHIKQAITSTPESEQSLEAKPVIKRIVTEEEAIQKSESNPQSEEHKTESKQESTSQQNVENNPVRPLIRQHQQTPGEMAQPIKEMQSLGGEIFQKTCELQLHQNTRNNHTVIKSHEINTILDLLASSALILKEITVQKD